MTNAERVLRLIANGKIAVDKNALLLKITKRNECWEWGGGRVKFGYGQALIEGAFIRAHRLFFTLFKHPIPDGELVCHRCDNPPCVNPDHLFTGTCMANVHDRISKGRSKYVSGEGCGRSVLTTVMVLKMRALRNQGATIRGIARQFGAAYSTVNYAINKRSWKEAS